MVAALIYAFNGLIFSREIQELSQKLRSLPVVIVLSSAVVVGLLLGNLIYQILRAILLSLFGMAYTFSFFFSFRAVGLTLFYFVFIYLFAQLKGRKRIRKMNIYDLIYFERRNEEVVFQKSKKRRGIFILSLILGSIGTCLIMMNDLLLGIIVAGCIIFFLYGFFLSFASGVPAYFDKRPASKYRKQNLLVFRTLTAKLATMGVLMATIALLFTATLISEGTGQIFSGIFQGRMAQYSELEEILSSIKTGSGKWGSALSNGGWVLYTKAQELSIVASMTAMTVFPLYYLALVLTMTAATILTIQQLCETDRYRRQFGLLQKLGMDRREREKALRGLFFIIYGVYILLAYTNLRRNVIT